MKQLTVNYHQDPGHGWLEVPLKTFLGVGASLAKLSGYSYCGQPGFDVIFYLEEDCDAAVFVEAAKARGVDVAFRSVYHEPECFIRELPGIPLDRMKAAMEEEGLQWA
jgi:hypothetical protein